MNPVNFNWWQTLLCALRVGRAPETNIDLADVLPKHLMVLVREFMMKSFVIIAMGIEKDFHSFDFVDLAWKKTRVINNEAREALENEGITFSLISNGPMSFLLHFPENGEDGSVFKGKILLKSGVKTISLSMSDDIAPIFSRRNGSEMGYLMIDGVKQFFSVQETMIVNSDMEGLAQRESRIVSLTDASLLTGASSPTKGVIIVNTDMNTFFILSRSDNTFFHRDIQKVTYDKDAKKLNVKTVATYGFYILHIPVVAIPSTTLGRNDLLLIGSGSRTNPLGHACYYFNTSTYKITEAPAIKYERHSDSGAVYIPICNSVFAFTYNSDSPHEVLDLNVPLENRKWQVLPNSDKLKFSSRFHDLFTYDLINMQ
jgi:hypothetical protein